MINGFAIGPIFIHFYGLIIMVGVLAATWLVQRQAKGAELNTDLAWDILLWVLIGGIIGARIWHILTPPPSMQAQGITTLYYLTHPLDAIAIWNGGLGIPGAVIGGGLALYLFLRKRRLAFVPWLDVIAPGLALGQAIGRWGNFVNKSCTAPPPTYPGQFTSTRLTGCPDLRTRLITIRSFCMNRYGTWQLWLFCSGWGGASKGAYSPETSSWCTCSSIHSEGSCLNSYAWMHPR
jgi:prolipoprotein diacylglyceryltransferase